MKQIAPKPWGILLFFCLGSTGLQANQRGQAAPVFSFNGGRIAATSTVDLKAIPSSSQGSEQLPPLWVAQQVRNELPPPPPLIQFGDDPNLVPGVPGQAGDGSSNASGTHYLVYVNGNSDRLLAQVRRVEPNAFRRNYGGRSVIQAGLFGDTFGANNRLQQLRDEGIGAQIEAIVATPTPVTASSPRVSSPSSSSLSSSQDDIPLPVAVVPQSLAGTIPSEDARSVAVAVPDASPYWIAIPASKSKLDDVVALVSLSGVNPPGIQAAKDGRGRFVKVGPFVDRQVAERWNRYLRELGMDARIDYQP